jgi:hypothetical protein
MSRHPIDIGPFGRCYLVPDEMSEELVTNTEFTALIRRLRLGQLRPGRLTSLLQTNSFLLVARKSEHNSGSNQPAGLAKPEHQG